MLSALLFGGILCCNGQTHTENVEDILWGLEKMKEDYIKQNSRDVVKFKRKDDGSVDVVGITIYGGPEADFPISDFPDPVAEKIVCSGSNGYKFARCVDDWLGDHEGQCLRVWYDGGTYYADDDCNE